MHHPTYRITHTTAFVTPVVEHWLEREIAREGSIRRPTAPWANALPLSYVPLRLGINQLRVITSNKPVTLGYSFWLAARDRLCAQTHMQNITYHARPLQHQLWNENNSMNPMTHHTLIGHYQSFSSLTV